MAVLEKIEQFNLLVLAPFSDVKSSTSQIISVDKWNFNEVMASFSINIPIPIHSLPTDETIKLEIRNIRDFHPDQLIQNTPTLTSLVKSIPVAKKPLSAEHSIQRYIADFTQKSMTPSLGEIKQPENKNPVSNPIDSILNMVSLPEASTPGASEANDIHIETNALLYSIIKRIFDNPMFKQLERSWRSLDLLVRQNNQNSSVKIQIMSVDWDTITETLNLLLEELIADLPGLIIIDLPFTHSPKDLEIIHHIARFGETLMTPVIIWVSPQFFDIETWNDLKKLSYIPHHLETPHYAKWKALREKPEGRWVAATCNQFLARNAYGKDNPSRLLTFEEPNPLWISPVWGAASLIIQSINRYGWGTHFMDRNRIFIADLPVQFHRGHACPTEAVFSQDRTEQFVRAGFMPLNSGLDKDILFLNTDAVISKATLSYQLLVSRITHWLIQYKDSVNIDITPSELKNRLINSINRFFEAIGPFQPKQVDVITRSSPDNGRILVKIILAPSKEILPGGGDPIVLEFNW